MAKDDAANTFHDLQNECKRLLSRGQDTEAMAIWKKGCAACRNTIPPRDWVMHQRNFVRDLKNDKLDDAATAVHAYLHANMPPGELIWKRSATGAPPLKRSETTSSTPSLYEVEHGLLNRSNRAATFGPQQTPPTRPEKGTAASAPAVPRARAERPPGTGDDDDDSGFEGGVRPAVPRASTLPVQKHHSGWMHNAKKRLIG